ncbi:MAG: UspA protein [Deltaproteobacteria bacterium]|nr:UspA protein [Deltaproteobacteria bacterium]
MFAPKRILVPTDFSEYSDAALKYAIDVAKQSGAKIYLLHVIGLIQSCTVDYCFDQSTLDALEEQSSSSAEDMMKHQLELFPDITSVDITTDVRKGVPYQEILNEQKAKDIDLIIMSSHGKTGLLGALLGSVAEKVMKRASCPVLLIRQPIPKEAVK